MWQTTERKTPIEEDVPKNEDFYVATDNIQQENDRDWLNTIKVINSICSIFLKSIIHVG